MWAWSIQVLRYFGKLSQYEFRYGRMRQATPPLRNLAQRLFEHEAKESLNPTELSEALQICCRRLHSQLGRLIGSGGFRALLERAVYLAKKEHSWLDTVTIAEYPGCELNGLVIATKGKNPETVKQAAILILANVIWLLVTFIGEDIALGLIREAWPNIAVSGEGQSETRVSR